METGPENAANPVTTAGADAERERRGGYLGFVAHEVRNPLSTALWTAELLARLSPEERGGARGEKLSSMCLRSLSRVRQLIEDHFMCERLDVGGLPVRSEEVVVRDLVESVVGRNAHGAGPTEIEIDPGLTVHVDRTLLERALESLVSLAGASGGTVRVQALAHEHELAITVAGDPPPPTLDDPRKGSPSDARGRALAVPLARRAASALGGALAIEDGRYLLTMGASDAYNSPPDPTSSP